MSNKTPSFVVTTLVNGARTVHVNDADYDPGDIGIDSRPGPDGTQDYFVTLKGQEPDECHMIIRSRQPVVEDEAMPHGSFLFCRGSCPDGFYCTQGNTQIDENTSLIYCGCAPKKFREFISYVPIIQKKDPCA